MQSVNPLNELLLEPGSEKRRGLVGLLSGAAVTYASAWWSFNHELYLE